MKRLGVSLAIVAVVGLGVIWWSVWGGREGTIRPGDGPAEDFAPLAAVRIEPRPATYPPVEGPYHGISWQVHNSRYALEEARLLLPQIAALGADTVLISNPGYQEHAGSDTFKIDKAVTPSREQWREIFKIAHENGLRVALMPIILLSKPRGTEWRGVIQPSNWDDWFEQYTRFILYFAGIAAENHVEIFSVGSELVSTERYADRWEKVIAAVRQVFPGQLTYSANWDHYMVVEYWNKLDLVGMTSYYKLSSDPNPELQTLLEEWVPIKRGLLKWHAGINKPLLFTEVGWCSQEGASIEPWNYFYKQEATPAGLEEQRRCYRAFMETWRDTPQVGGIIWWEWMNVPGGPSDFNYTPKGKPAEQELRAWFKEIKEKRAKATPPGK